MRNTSCSPPPLPKLCKIISSFLVAYRPKKSESENNAYAWGGEGAVDRGYYGGGRVANAIDFLCLSRQYKEEKLSLMPPTAEVYKKAKSRTSVSSLCTDAPFLGGGGL